MMALTLLLIIIGYLILSIIIGYFIHVASNKKISNLLSCGIILSLPFIYAAVSYLPGYFKLQSLCNADDRTKIYKTVNVDGYLFASNTRKSCIGDSWQTLLDNDYKYVECSTEKYINDKFHQGNKFYNFTVENKGYLGCQIEDNKIKYRQKEFAEKYKQKLIGKCLSREEVFEPKSRYMSITENGYIDSKGEHNIKKPDNYRNIKNLITFVQTRRIDRSNNELLSISRNYWFYPANAKNHFAGKFTCDKQTFINIKDIFITN